jgi:hypothetical protein
MAEDAGVVIRLVRKVPGLQLGNPRWLKVAAIVAYLTGTLMLLVGFLVFKNRLLFLAFAAVGVAVVAGLVRYAHRAVKAHSISTYVDLVSRAANRQRLLDKHGPPAASASPEDVVPAMLRAFVDDALPKVRDDTTPFQELSDIGTNLDVIRRDYLPLLTPELSDLYWEVREQFTFALERRIGLAPEQDDTDHSVGLIKRYLEAVHPFADSIVYESWSETRWAEIAGQFFWAVEVGYTAKVESGERRDHQHIFLIQHGRVVEVADKRTGLPGETTLLVNPLQVAERHAQAAAGALVREVAGRLTPGLAGERFRFAEPPRFVIERLRAIEEPRAKGIALRELARFGTLLATHQNSQAASGALLDILEEVAREQSETGPADPTRATDASSGAA